MLGMSFKSNCDNASTSRPVPKPHRRDLGKKHVESGHVVPPFVSHHVTQPISRGFVDKPRSHSRFVLVCHHRGKA